MEKIEVKKMVDLIIVERSEGNSILKDSKLFCGCCGKPLATAKKKLTLPFKSDVLHKGVKGKSYEISVLGMRHKTCGHTMFGFKQKYSFMRLADYLQKRN